MIRFLPLLFLLSSITCSLAQFNGKPQYDILVRQFPDTIGTMRIELYPTIAPLHCINFDTLAQQGFYDSLAFHRVVPNFVIQGGDPNSKTGPSSTWGQGAPWQQTVPAEFGPLSHDRSIIGAARGNDINSATSQFYINTNNNTNLNGNYTAYGKVISGMNFADSIEAVPRNANDLPLDKVDMFIQYVGLDTSAPSNAPNLLSPADGAVDLFGSEDFVWSAVTSNDFLLYRIEFSKVSDFSVIEYSEDIRKNKTDLQPLSNLEQGYVTYYWRVLTNNGGRLTASASRSFTTFIVPPVLDQPLNMASNTNTNPLFVWNPVNGADEYNLVISRLPSLATPFFYELDTTISGTSIISPILGENRNLYWGVRSVRASVKGEFSEMREFTTGTSINGIDNDNFSQYSLYPNPTNGYLHLNLDFDHNDEIIFNLFDLNSKKVMSLRIDTNQIIDISVLPQGLYFYTLEANGSLQRGKILKE